jgi:hypothetical protein
MSEIIGHVQNKMKKKTATKIISFKLQLLELSNYHWLQLPRDNHMIQTWCYPQNKEYGRYLARRNKE